MSNNIGFDQDGVAIPGTYPISTVHLGAWSEGGKPMPTVESAVCDICGEWASNVWTAGKTSTRDDDMFDVRISRRLRVTVYACPRHSEQVVDALVDEYGAASNAVDPDELAQRVDKSQRFR